MKNIFNFKNIVNIKQSATNHLKKGRIKNFNNDPELFKDSELCVCKYKGIKVNEYTPAYSIVIDVQTEESDELKIKLYPN